MSDIRLTGTGVALCTPFDDGKRIDFNALERLVRFNIKEGVEYLVALGTTAETATLSKEEKKDVLQCIINANEGKLPIVLGVGGNDTLSVAKDISLVDFSEIHAILSVSPYYNGPTQEGLYQHYKYLAKETQAPILMYNVPWRTGRNMEPATTLRLANEFPNLIGIKDAPGNFQQFVELLANKPKGFMVISGDDFFALPLTLAGGDGVISVLGQGLPESFTEMIRLGLSKKTEEAYQLFYKLYPFMGLIFEEGNPAGIKALLKLRQICESGTRLPLVEASKDLSSRLSDALNHVEVKA